MRLEHRVHHPGQIQVAAIFSSQSEGVHRRPSVPRRAREFFLAVLSAFFFAAPALAVHEVDHRFTVWGEVLTSEGEPVSDETITLMSRDDEIIGSVVTNARGRFRVVLHVHDDDVGKVFDIVVRGVKTKVKLEFDPGDHNTERGKRVDFTIKK